MDGLVFVKSSRHGLVIQLDENASYSELLLAIEHKFQDTAGFFKHTKLAVSFEGRFLTEAEKQEIVSLISRTAGVQIVCVIENNDARELMYKRAVDRSLPCTGKRDGQFYRGNLKKKQLLESETSVVIVGNVECGATVVANGNIVVLGTIEGNVHAGANGSRNAFISAFHMAPEEICIGDIRAKRHITKEKAEFFMAPKIAVVDGEHIYIDPLSY